MVFQTSVGLGGLNGLPVVIVYDSRSCRKRNPPRRSTRQPSCGGIAHVRLSSPPPRLFDSVACALPRYSGHQEISVTFSCSSVTSKYGSRRSTEPGWPVELTLLDVLREGT